MNSDVVARLAKVSVLAGALLGTCIARSSPAAETIAAGSGSFQFVDALGNRDKPITVWTHAPRRLRATSPVVFVMHGVRRNGREYRDQWVEHAEKRAFLLIVPEFSEQHYSSEAYQRGNMFDAADQPVDPSLWTYTAIEHLFDHVQEMTGNKAPRYFLYGHSAGGQFVQRLALFLPQARYQRAIAANPGWYTMPDAEIAFPYGLRGTTADASNLKQCFANRFVLLLGSEDTKRDDPNLRKTPEADAQGLTRFERGKNYFQAARQRANDLETEFAWKQQVVRGAGHSDKQMSKAAATVFFAR